MSNFKFLVNILDFTGCHSPSNNVKNQLFHIFSYCSDWSAVDGVKFIM